MFLQIRGLNGSLKYLRNKRKEISKLISPELIKVLMEMGHGDEIVLEDGNFPVSSHARRWIRYDGYDIENQTQIKKPFEYLDRLAFYERAKNAYAIIATGEGALYANIILKKGVIAE